MDPTVEQLRKRAEETVVGRLHFQQLMWRFNKPKYPEWVQHVEEGVAHQISEMASRRNDLHDLDEDALTAVVVIALRNLDMDIDGKVVNGNADLSIEFDDYRWLGEAKIALDASKLYHGYQQLTSRYSTGLPNGSAGGMLLYCTHDSAKVILDGWKAALEHQVPHSNPIDGEMPLSFRSTDTCGSTGLSLDIVHLAFPLFHKPLENESKLSKKAIMEARNARAKARKSAS
ncbi:hypothetical protein [Novilysobacter erysipheiresistens]|uniref:PD-(D/E)XK endonuclease-like domain-containing protein n=1 Tax=Novilysobacter erysipheiresistens TaxID=1749332 RepID=A0ABU7YZB6_9GAMM